MTYTPSINIERVWVAKKARIPARRLQYFNQIPLWRTTGYEDKKTGRIYEITPEGVFLRNGKKVRLGPGLDSKQFAEFERQRR